MGMYLTCEPCIPSGPGVNIILKHGVTLRRCGFIGNINLLHTSGFQSKAVCKLRNRLDDMAKRSDTLSHAPRVVSSDTLSILTRMSSGRSWKVDPGPVIEPVIGSQIVNNQM